MKQALNKSKKNSNQLLQAIEENLGRPLRVLHIGNIANNAYNNARIQREYGIEADVLSYDYYHVMGTPEWEDEEFSDSINDMYPNWWETSLGGWKRPKWFAQGPKANACLYLLAKQLKLENLTEVLWDVIEQKSYERTVSESPKGPKIKRSFLRQKLASINLARTCKLDELILPRFGYDEIDSVCEEALGSSKASHEVGISMGRSYSLGWRNSLKHFFSFHMNRFRLRGGRGRASTEELILSEGRQLRDLLDLEKCNQNLLPLKKKIGHVKSQSVDAESERIQLLYWTDWVYRHSVVLNALFKTYDVIQGYSVDGFSPWFLGYKYMCYEHGTLRDLPFNADFYGVMSNISYGDAEYSFVTNSDVIPSVQRMGLEAGRVVCLPHAFDDRRLLEFRSENKDIHPPRGVPIIFSPARQHWNKKKSASWRKGNDVLLKAAAVLAKEGWDFHLHLTEWGEDIEASKALISKLGISDKVSWLPIMQKQKLWEAYCSAHVVVDQFVLPALGGVGFEAMALGRRLITVIDTEQTAWFFGEAPPCLAAGTVEECADQLRLVMSDPEDEKGLGDLAQRWVQEYHSASRILDIQARTYGAFLKNTDS